MCLCAFRFPGFDHMHRGQSIDLWLDTVKGQFMKLISVWILGASLLVFASPSVRAQSSSTEQPATLADLLTEAEKNNPQIQAARHGWQSAKQIPTQVATLPDPQVVLQQMNVGSPRPFAGYTNSDFSYIGFGFSQDLPYPASCAFAVKS